MTDLTKRPKHISDILIYRLANLSTSKRSQRLANLSTSKRSLPSAEVAAVISFCSNWLLTCQVCLLFQVISWFYLKDLSRIFFSNFWLWSGSENLSTLLERTPKKLVKMINGQVWEKVYRRVTCVCWGAQTSPLPPRKTISDFTKL